MRWGHNEHDVIWEYSVEKVTRYFEAIARRESQEFYAEAVRLHQAFICANPAQTKKHAQQMNASWKKYLEAIAPDKIREKKKKKNPMSGLMEKFANKIPMVEE